VELSEKEREIKVKYCYLLLSLHNNAELEVGIAAANCAD
jgi:hypothetical protein